MRGAKAACELAHNSGRKVSSGVMTAARFDVIVAGLGAMGSATAYHLALRGVKVLGLDRWAPGHTFGSSHGDSRIIREAYFEHPMYVPILRRAYELWRELEERSGEALLREIGGLMIGPPDGELVTGTLRSASEFGIAHDVLSPADVRRLYPAFELQPTEIAVLDRRAGYLDPDRCNAAHLRVAQAAGATLRFNEPVRSWAASDDGVRVETSRESYVADHLVLSVGARMPQVAADLRLPLVVERQLLFWLEPNVHDTRFDPASFPIYLYEYAAESGFSWCYGFPRLPRGIKAAVMHKGEVVEDADLVRRSVDAGEVAPLRRALSTLLPDVARAPVRESAVCLFTNTPDLHFVIDVHPAYPRVVLSSACSGHGFKFASAIGEIQADLVTAGQSRFDLSAFSATRFVSR
jgi:sarcosine oxidase